MRKILFRAKDEHGMWHEGFYVCAPVPAHFIERWDPHVGELMRTPVSPETVGQYTGFVDKDGTRIFEGDIVSFTATENDHYQRGAVYKTPVQYWQGSFCINSLVPLHTLLQNHITEVIGNIYDEPELLEI